MQDKNENLSAHKLEYLFQEPVWELLSPRPLNTFQRTKGKEASKDPYDQDINASEFPQEFT